VKGESGKGEPKSHEPKDQRGVGFFRGQLESLIESLTATVRIGQWQSDEGIPEPLRGSAAKLLDRLGVANRLAADKYAGPARVVACLTAMSKATQRLDAAYVLYRRSMTLSPAQRGEAATVLDVAIEDVKAGGRLDWAA
jgi:hypothetical protein